MSLSGAENRSFYARKNFAGTRGTKKPGMSFDIPGFRLRLKRQADAAAILVVLAEVRLRTILRSFRPLRILRTLRALRTTLSSLGHIF